MNPLSLFERRHGSALVGGVPIEKIAAKTGTPLYVYDAAILRRQYEKLSRAMPPGVKIHFSLKANPSLAVAEIFRELGAGAEVASYGELELAMNAGFAPEDVIYAGPGKSEREIHRAVELGIGSINVESETELARVIKAAGPRRAKVAFRVNPDFEGDSNEDLMFGGPRKFGFDGEALEPVVRKALASKKVEALGFHFFAGTGLTDSRALTGAYGVFAEWVRKFAGKLDMNVRTLNFGGGLGIPFRDDEPELDVRAVGRALGEIREKLKKSPGFGETAFMVEPGRYLAGPSGVYVTRVSDIKKSRGVAYVITDGGINHALVPIVMNKYYPTAILNKMDKPRRFECQVAGPLCASPDQFSRRVRIQKPEIGDLLGVFNSGAYGYSAGMQGFLSHPAPAEVMADEGKTYLMRERRAPDFGGRSRLRL